MPLHVGQRLLRGPQERDLDLRAHRLRLARLGHRGRDAGDLRPAAGDVGERLGQPRPVERLGPHRLDGAARLRQRVAREPLGGVQVPAALVGAPVRGRLELGDDPRQPLRQRVVELARHPPALVEHPRLARLREELAVQPRVLLRGGLELRV